MIEIIEHGTIGKTLGIEVIKETSYFLDVNITKKNTSKGRFYSLITRKGEPIVEAVRYITNPKKKIKSNNTKEKELRHIGILYKFLDAFDIDINRLINDEEYIIIFMHFLAKKNYESDKCKMKFIRELSVDSINLYYATIINYLEFLKYDKKSLIFDSSFKNIFQSKRSVKLIKSRGVADANSSFTTEELANIFNYAKKNYPLLYTGVIVMFETGMRIGTMLSITEEDIQYETDKKGNILRYIIKVRNRFSNADYQHIKNLPKIHAADYCPNHKTDKENIDYFIYTISYDLYLLLQSLINQNFKNSKSSDYAKNQYETVAVADRYYEYIKPKHKNNHYVFLNKTCGRMSDNNWNKRYLKPTLDALGIYRDVDIKKHGLNHVIRHTSFTFLCASGVLKTDAEKLNFLKNTSIDTLITYYTPSIEMSNAVALVQSKAWQTLEQQGCDTELELQKQLNSNTLLEIAGDI